MYVRVRLQQGVDEKALLVPDQAIQRTADGLSSLMVVKDGKVQPVAVWIGSQTHGHSIILKGLNPGVTGVVVGFQKIRPGEAVQAILWKEQQPGVAADADSGTSAPPSKPPTQG